MPFATFWVLRSRKMTEIPDFHLTVSWNDRRNATGAGKPVIGFEDVLIIVKKWKIFDGQRAMRTSPVSTRTLQPSNSQHCTSSAQHSTNDFRIGTTIFVLYRPFCQTVLACSSAGPSPRPPSGVKVLKTRTPIWGTIWLYKYCAFVALSLGRRSFTGRSRLGDPGGRAPGLLRAVDVSRVEHSHCSYGSPFGHAHVEFGKITSGL